jgi:hypothetical protein
LNFISKPPSWIETSAVASTSPKRLAKIIKIQIKFHYSSPHDINIAASPSQHKKGEEERKANPDEMMMTRRGKARKNHRNLFTLIAEQIAKAKKDFEQSKKLRRGFIQKPPPPTRALLNPSADE